jgi:hypothetical protein
MKTDYTPGFILRFLTGNLSACLFLWIFAVTRYQ